MNKNKYMSRCKSCNGKFHYINYIIYKIYKIYFNLQINLNICFDIVQSILPNFQYLFNLRFSFLYYSNYINIGTIKYIMKIFKNLN